MNSSRLKSTGVGEVSLGAGTRHEAHDEHAGLSEPRTQLSGDEIVLPQNVLTYFDDPRHQQRPGLKLTTAQWYAQTECLIETRAQSRLSVKVRCLQLQRRTIEERTHSGDWRSCIEARVADRELVSWDEAVAREIDCEDLSLDDVCRAEHRLPFELQSGLDFELVSDECGNAAARFVRERWAVAGLVRVSAERSGNVAKLRVRIENVTHIESAFDDRDDRDVALRRSLLGCHTFLGAEGGAFVSLMDPPSHLTAQAAACRNEHTWPVLAGPAGSRDVMLSSAIILYDYPAVAAESSGDFFDATEIDELLALRVNTMTEDERRAAAATDDAAAQILGRAAEQSLDDPLRLHGAVRERSAPKDALASWESTLNPPGEPAPEIASIAVDGAIVSAGSRVRLHPRRRADAIDIFLTSRTATVSGVYRDLESRVHVAVTVDDDPAADLNRAFGRYLYFSPDELLPLTAEPLPTPLVEPGSRFASTILRASRSDPTRDEAGDVRRSMRTLVAGLGNIFLGDEAFGVEVTRKLQEQSLPEGVRLLDVGLGSMHLSYELAGDNYQTLVLIDVVARGRSLCGSSGLVVYSHDRRWCFARAGKVQDTVRRSGAI